ncbi:MAG: hypothetical protein KDI36_10270 [Pseudomonadales bacterium]|nr:hypothetical protein [Pseudomonadales bacterium]
MKLAAILKTGAAVIVISLAALLALQFIASERVEVVELETTSASGEAKITRLWVVDEGGFQYLRAGGDSGWYQRLLEQPQVRVSRNGNWQAYEAREIIGMGPQINQLMNDKYTWGDDLIGMMINRADAKAIRLIPRE